MPDWGPELRARLSTVRLSPAREAEIVEELSQHLEDRRCELLAAGARPEDAIRIARTEFSERNVLAQYLTPLRQARWIDPSPPASTRALSLQGLAADVRHAVRALRAAPSFTIGALLVLALGTGATTAIFSVVDAVVLRGLPFDEADRIVAVGERAVPGKAGAGKPMPAVMPGASPGDPDALGRIEPQNYLDWVAEQRVFAPMAALAVNGEYTLDVPGAEPEAIAGDRVTASFFDVLRVAPALGRLFTVDNEAGGRDRVVLLSHAFWRRHFAADAAVVGRTMSMNGEAYEVVGVMPSGFSCPGAIRPADVWVPYVMLPGERVRGRGRSIYLQSIARLRPGVSIAQAQTQMDQVASALALAHPATNSGRGIGVRPLRDHLVGASTQSWMAMLLAAVGIVLLIACANVANLWLARASARARDVAVRAALGAGRWRLARLCLVESLVVSTAGTVLGAGLAWQGIHLLKAAMPEDVARAATIGLDLRVIAVATGLALATGVLSGILPALQASRPGLVSVLNESARAGGAGRARRRLRSGLVIVEVGFAVVLLVGAALFIGSFVNVMRVDLGFRGDHVLTAQILPRLQPGPSSSAQDIGPAFSEIVERLRLVPGVVDAAAASPGIPLRVNIWIDRLSVPGKAIDGDSSVSIKIVTPGYHRALTIPLRSGRLFDDHDRTGDPPVVILSDAAARVFFAGEDAVGRTVVLGRLERTVVGVTGNARQSSLEANPHPEVYLPMAQSPSRSGYLVIRTSGDPSDVAPSVRAIVSGVLPGEPLRYVATMDGLVAGQTAARRLNMLMLGLFGLLGLVISAVGIFGVMAYLVAQRTREIGVRMALGATRARIVAMVLRNAAGLVGGGIAAGGATAWYAAAAARRFLFGLDAHDGRAFLIAAATLSVAALVACVLPARRAAGVDPTVALRSE